MKDRALSIKRLRADINYLLRTQPNRLMTFDHHQRLLRRALRLLPAVRRRAQ